MKIIMNGALGRMGRRILTLASEDRDFIIAGAVDVHSSQTGDDIGEIIGIGKTGVPLTDNLTGVIRNADVVIDFTLPDAVFETASVCAQSNVPLVVGITGLTQAEQEELARRTKTIPCVFAPNMSVGVNLLFKLVAETASILGGDYDIEITEVHHRFKKDAPSGTARRLAEIIAESRMTPLEDHAVYGRVGITGERPPNEIGIHAIRAGDVVGEHTVTFGTIGERIELTHKAQSRDTFAKGALRAAKFVVNAPPGMYDMQDVLGLKNK